MTILAYLKNYRIFVIALAVSLVWHLLCISIIKVEKVKVAPQSVKFSKVSFLGPILGARSVELRVEPRPASFLEKRYIRHTEVITASAPDLSRSSYNMDADIPSQDNRMPAFIKDAINTPKTEPKYGVDY